MRCNCAPSALAPSLPLWCRVVPVSSVSPSQALRLHGALGRHAAGKAGTTARNGQVVAVCFVNVAHPHHPCKSERVSPHRVELAQARKKKKARQATPARVVPSLTDPPLTDQGGATKRPCYVHTSQQTFSHTPPATDPCHGPISHKAWCRLQPSAPSKRAPLVFPAHEDA